MSVPRDTGAIPVPAPRTGVIDVTIRYVMYREGFRYDMSGGKPLYDGCVDTGFDTLEEACAYTVAYYRDNHGRDTDLRAHELWVVPINVEVYADRVDCAPEDYEGQWLSYTKARSIVRRAGLN